jgi:dimethylaniline monooxygenase (N-oxide forming)
MLCTGHHSIPKFPQYTGWCLKKTPILFFLDIKHFKGRVIHAKEYTDFAGFEDKHVFLVGIGNSSLDIAVELTKVARSVTVSTRRGSWIFNRVAQV